MGNLTSTFVFRGGERARVFRGGVMALALFSALSVTGCAAEPDPGVSVAPSATATAQPEGQATPGPTTPGPTEAAPLPTQAGPIDQPIELGTGVRVSIVSVVSTTVKAETPGEVAGPAVVVTVDVRNDSTETQSVDSAVVTLVAADGGFGIPTTAGAGEPLSGSVEPKATVRGTYVFMLDPAAGRDVVVSINYAAGEPVAEFTGKVS